jgi:hypothetical protein
MIFGGLYGTRTFAGRPTAGLEHRVVSEVK